jgi:hypothetical protein
MTSTRTEPFPILTPTVTIPPGRRDAECRTALVNNSLVSSATSSAAGKQGGNPATHVRALATDSGRPAKERVQVAVTAGPAVTGDGSAMMLVTVTFMGNPLLGDNGIGIRPAGVFAHHGRAH